MKALSLRGLRKTYKNGLEALKGIDLEVDSGDFFALLGPNGAGKSTTIGIISSLVNKTSGHVEIFGHDLDRDTEPAKRLIGIVPQEVNFNQFETVLGVVVNQAGYQGIPRKEANLRAEQCLTQLGLWDKRNSVSRTLSGGMKRRLMIARAMMTNPQLLILDEPTAGVDIEIRRDMWRVLEQINREGTTIILTTHYLEEAEQLCRHVAIIDRGQIVERAPMRELLAKLDVEGFVLDTEGELPAALPVIEGASLVVRNAHTLELDKPRAMDLVGVFTALGAAGVQVRSMRTRSNRLEELFVRLTGKKD